MPAGMGSLLVSSQKLPVEADMFCTVQIGGRIASKILLGIKKEVRTRLTRTTYPKVNSTCNTRPGPRTPQHGFSLQ